MQQQLPGAASQGMGAGGAAHGPFTSRAMPSQLQQQQPGAPGPPHLTMYPNMGMNLPQNGLQPHGAGPMYGNMGSLNGPPPYMMNRHLGGAGPQQPLPAGQSPALPGPQVGIFSLMRSSCTSASRAVRSIAIYKGGVAVTQATSKLS